MEYILYFFESILETNKFGVYLGMQKCLNAATCGERSAMAMGSKRGVLGNKLVRRFVYPIQNGVAHVLLPVPLLCWRS